MICFVVIISIKKEEQGMLGGYSDLDLFEFVGLFYTLWCQYSNVWVNVV